MRKIKILLGIATLLSLALSLEAQESIEKDFWTLLRTMDKTLQNNRQLLKEYKALYTGAFTNEANKIKTMYGDSPEGTRKTLEMEANFLPRFLAICNRDTTCGQTWQSYQNDSHTSKDFWPLLQVMDRSLKDANLIREFDALYYGEFGTEANKVMNLPEEEREIGEIKLQASFFDRFLKICNQDPNCAQAWKNRSP